MRRQPGIGGLQTAAAARTRGDRPDHEAVDAAKARLAEIDSMFSNDLDEIKLEEKQKKAIERERQMHKTLISLDQMHQSYDKMLCKAEKRLEKLYESVNAGKQPLHDINRAYVLPIKMMKKSLDKHHDDSANEISSSSKIDQKLCFKITSLTTAISVGSTAAQKRKQNTVSVGKERREALFRTKRLCRAGVSTDTDIPIDDNDMMIEEEQSILESQTTSAVQELNLAITFQGKGAVQKKVNSLRKLRRLLSKSGAIPLLAQCLSFGSQDEQLLEAAWCLTNIAAGKPACITLTYCLYWSSVPVAEQCAWAIGNVAGEGDELRQILISQGALLPLAKMMLPNKGSTGPDPKAATELIKVDGVVEAILRYLRKSVLVKTDVLQLLVEILMLIPQLEALVGRHSRPLTFWIGSQQKKQCFQQAEEHCSKAISLDKKYLEDGVEKMKIQCLECGYETPFILVVDHNLVAVKTADLRALAAEMYGLRELKNSVIKDLTRRVLGKEMSKPKGITMSRWDNQWLSGCINYRYFREF
ncbi:hypothetical protein LXL04_032916 [Taraxacum kok-saghyz]